MAKARRHWRRRHPRTGTSSSTTSRPASGGGQQVRHASFDGQPLPESWPSVSLCMIVKNEEQHLPGCLESVRELVDEMIVVDTGSSDRTVEIAQSLGARVEHFAWINDFAAARNESLRFATKEYILWLDADDRVSPENVARMKKALASGLGDVYACRNVSRDRDGQIALSVRHFSLFRNGIGLAFEGRVHEKLVRTDARYSIRPVETDITIDHIGYAADPATLRRKTERNRDLLLQCLAAEPDNPYWHFHLGETYHQLGEWLKAIEHLQIAIEKGDARHFDADIERYQAHTTLISAYERSGKVDKAEELLQKMQGQYSHRRHMWIYAGMFYAAHGKPERALDCLTRAQALPRESDAWGLQWPDGILESALWQTHLLLGNVEQAKEAYLSLVATRKEALESIPSSTLDAARKAFDGGDYNRVLELLQGYSPADPELLRLLKTAAVRAGRTVLAFDYLCRAVTLAGAATADWLELSRLALEAGDLNKAKLYAGLAERWGGDQGEALNLMSLTHFAEGNLASAIECLVRASIQFPGSQNVRINLARMAASAGITTTDAIKQQSLIFANKGDYSAAAAALSLALELSPEDPHALKLMAVVLNKLGREDDALLCWQTAQRVEAAITA